MKKTLSLLSIILCLIFLLCSCKTDTIEPEPTVNETFEPVYENVSRPIKDFWFIRENLLTLTEAGELYCGEINTSNPIFITDNVKDIKLSDDGYEGLILLNNGDVILINDRYESESHLSFYNIIMNNSSPNTINATYKVNAQKLFNHAFYIGEFGYLYDINQNIIIDKPIKDGFISEFSTNYETQLDAVFILDDGTAIHYFNLYGGEPKVRTITTDTVAVFLDKSTLDFTSNGKYCSIIRSNGDLLCWVLDSYTYENDPLSEITKIASDANTEKLFPVYYQGGDVLYVNKQTQLIRFNSNSNSTEILYHDIKDVFFEKLDLEHLGIFKTAVLTNDNDLIWVDQEIPIAQNVIGIAGNGQYLIYDDYKCARFDGEKSFYDRTQNVIKAESRILGGEQQVFLKYGGALYASDSKEGNVYKTSFCEKNISLYFNENKYTPKQAIQTVSGMYMLPYDECCELLGLTGIADNINNSVIIENNNDTIEFLIDSNNILINGKTHNISATIYKDSHGNVWIPIQTIAEFSGYAFEIDETKDTINITK